MPTRGAGDGLKLVRDTSWDHLGIPTDRTDRIDPSLRLIASLIEARDFVQLFRRTGLWAGEGATPAQSWLPLFIEIEPTGRRATLSTLTNATIRRTGFLVKIPSAYREEMQQNRHLEVVTARFDWKKMQATRQDPLGPASIFREAVANLIRTTGVKRVTVPNPMQPCLESALADIDMPPNRTLNGRKLDGKGIVVGIIDDGCALAHRNFLVPGKNRSRIRYLWDQARTSADGGWQMVSREYGGFELPNNAINAAIASCVTPHGLIDENEVYDSLHYEIGPATHGTHVMDIAAGNGQSLIGTEGVACAADIIFVQLPTDLVEQGGPVLEDRMLDGVKYIFDRAKGPAVVNISYGGYSGPHDGSSPLASGIDALLSGRPDRAVVVSAGNGFEADCHAQGVLPIATPRSRARAAPLHWTLNAGNPTTSQLEVWYDTKARLSLSITPPGATKALKPPVMYGESFTIQRISDGALVGRIDHAGTDSGLKPNVVRIQLNSTQGEYACATGNADAAPAKTAPAPSGIWKIDLENVGDVRTTFHAWIARDDFRRVDGRLRPQQSRFDSVEAEPRHSVADLATGKLSICVGAHNTATGEMCRYSAAGPTRDGRHKPDVCAPAEETAAGGGILCATSRSGSPSRMNGTSAAAPQVAGLVALMMQYNAATGGAPLTADKIRKTIRRGSQIAEGLPPPPLRRDLYNDHQDIDPDRPAGKKQSDHFGDVTGVGKANVTESTKLLP
jgi:subtilisin family serine protease